MVQRLLGSIEHPQTYGINTAQPRHAYAVPVRSIQRYPMYVEMYVDKLSLGLC